MEKFSSFKLRFQRNLKKVQDSSKSGAGTIEIYEPTWIHYERLNFLKESNATDKSVSFLDIQKDAYLDFFGKENEEACSPENSPLVPTLKQATKKRKLKEDESEDNSLSNNVMTAALALIKQKTSQAQAPAKPKELDEHEAFCVVVHQKLRKLDASDSEMLMNDIWMSMLKYKPKTT